MDEIKQTETQTDITVTAKNEIEAICQKYNVTLMPVIVHEGNQTYSYVDVIQINSVLPQ